MFIRMGLICFSWFFQPHQSGFGREALTHASGLYPCPHPSNSLHTPASHPHNRHPLYSLIITWSWQQEKQPGDYCNGKMPGVDKNKNSLDQGKYFTLFSQSPLNQLFDQSYISMDHTAGAILRPSIDAGTRKNAWISSVFAYANTSIY